MTNTVGIIVAGCGSISGSDPYETVLLFNTLTENNYNVIFLTLSSKSQIKKSSEISRGKLLTFKEVSPKMFCAVMIPGGQGVVWNLLKRNGEAKEEVNSFLREIHFRKGIIYAMSMSVTILTRSFPEYSFNFDLLKIKSGTYLLNEELNFIVSPGSISSSSILEIKKEITSVVNEIERLLKNK